MTDCGANWHAAPMSFADHRAERAANVAFREGLERRRRAEEEVVSAHSRGTAALAAFRAGSSGDFLTLSPPAEKANARQDQAGQASTGDGGGDGILIDDQGNPGNRGKANGGNLSNGSSQSARKNTASVMPS